jgi:putative hemolysin
MDVQAQRDSTLSARPPRPARDAEATPAQRFDVRWATQLSEVREAQRLRYAVFAGEMGAQIAPMPGTPIGHDVDRFDEHCEHLLIRAAVGPLEDVPPGEVIGTYRVMTPAAAQRAGGWYSETEFDLRNLRPLLGSAVELGRSCVHPDWRGGAVVMALWGALGEFMLKHELTTMIGCASVSVRDGGDAAASLWTQLRRTHLANEEWRVEPHLPLPVHQLQQGLDVETPPLIKGYLRCGAKVLGPPAWDPAFQSADLPLMMRFEELPPRYRRHFLGS